MTLTPAPIGGLPIVTLPAHPVAPLQNLLQHDMRYDLTSFIWIYIDGMRYNLMSFIWIYMDDMRYDLMVKLKIL